MSLDPKTDFSWLVALGKGIRDALLSLVPAVVGAVILALAGIMSPDQLAVYGVPAWLIPFMILGFTTLRNVLRNKFGWPVLVLLSLGLLPAPAQAQGVGEFLQGLTDPHIVGGAAYNSETKTWAAVLTANVVGPKLGTLPCYIAGVGVGLNTIAPGLEDLSIAAVSFPIVTCAPFGEQVVIQGGMSTPLNGPGGESYYAGLGVSLSGGPNELKAKRVARAKAKAAKKADLSQGPPAPAS